MAKDIQIGSRRIGLSYPPYIVAEISGNHQGSLERALQLVEKAKEAGAHAVKLQTYSADTITLDSTRPEFFIDDRDSLWQGRSLYDLYKEASLPWEWHAPIFKRCHELGITAFSTPFDETAVDFLEQLHVPCYKIASLEIVDLPLIEKIAKTKKPIILSTGASTFLEIADAVEAARRAGCEELILLKCTNAYPAQPQDAHLRTLPHLAQSFDVTVGLSDHTLGLAVPLTSVALGACLIEKHFTLSRQEGGVDAAFSLEPQELNALVVGSEKAWQSLGRVRYAPLPSEKVAYSHRPSLYFVVDLEAGAVVKPEHFKSIRPANGLPPKEAPLIIGMVLQSSVTKGTPVSWDLFKLRGLQL